MEKNQSDFRPIFVVGNARSGTTLMASILRKHPDIFMFHELHFFEQLWTPEQGSKVISWSKGERLCGRLLNIQDKGYNAKQDLKQYADDARDMIATIDCNKLNTITVYETFLKKVTANNGKIFPGEQTPQNVFYIGEILGLFPGARFINMIRDPRDVLASQKNKWKIRTRRKKNMSFMESLRLWINYHPITTSELWSSSIKASERFADDSRILFLRFEDLIFHPEKTLREICDFLEVQFDESMMDIRHITSSFLLENANQKGFNRKSVGRWKSALTATEVFYCERINKDKMERYGYSLSNACPARPSLGVTLITFPIKLALAFALNYNRYASFFSSLKKRLS